ncbi:hypothetical protein K504DRAFT_462195 [Pleomassaria siparia CBS 279.74]|uniref:Uncharacterized protein n=1 Tax=Pleomassaria siparia CBS 279.74 TaxID=1314801 RepID=A0A6G1KMY8_9PLEO|nr:hypothetical protein K504DRAFT_462195 [Pleomassaria siparia CBS 279.74]
MEASYRADATRESARLYLIGRTLHRHLLRWPGNWNRGDFRSFHQMPVVLIYTVVLYRSGIACYARFQNTGSPTANGLQRGFVSHEGPSAFGQMTRPLSPPGGLTKSRNRLRAEERRQYKDR